MEKVSEENLGIFRERIAQMNLGGLNWNVTSDITLKKSKDNMCARVIINNATQKSIYGDDVIFVINEDVFDRLQEHSQIIVIDKLLAQINYDLEKEKVKKNSPDIQEHSGILYKYKFEILQSLSAEISQIYQKMKEEATGNDGKDARE